MTLRLSASSAPLRFNNASFILSHLDFHSI